MMNAVISERLKARFDRWDVGGTGLVSRSDFEHEADRIVRAFGRGTTSPAARNLRSALCWMFDVVAGESGTRPDGAVNEQQFREVCADLIFEHGEAAFNRLLTPVLSAVIGLCEKREQGRIKRAEFATWLTALGMGMADGLATFDRIDQFGRGELSLAEMLQAVRDYHYGRLDIELIRTGERDAAEPEDAEPRPDAPDLGRTGLGGTGLAPAGLGGTELDPLAGDRLPAGELHRT